MILRPSSLRPLTTSFLRPRLQPNLTMPLRAKILDPNVSGARSIVTETENVTSLDGDTPDDVVFNSLYGLRTIELNRPKKLNSLDGSMCRKIIPRLREWEKSQMINAVIIKGAGEKSLCAGGDVATLALWNQEGPEGRQKSKDYFALEYKLDHLIASYSKPYIAFMDGATMGGGVGLSVHAPFRIATERTNLAMPETRIGFFPEVGASFFLPRLEGALGKYLALTSESLRGVQAFYHGFATHFLHSSSLPDLEHRLAELTFPDSANREQRLRIIDSTISEFVTGLPHDQPIQLSGELRKAIDYCFASYDIKSILWRLEKTAQHPKSPENIKKWAQKTLATVGERSPTSVKVTLRQLSLGREWNIAEAFRREHLIASQFMEHPDFVEGVSARLIRKPATTPQWKPATLDDVSDADVDAFFRTPQGVLTLQFFKQGPEAQYTQYPHAWLALPTEDAVRALIQKEALSRDDVIKHFLRTNNNKIGVREKVEEILSRMAKVDGGQVTWVPSLTAVQEEERKASSKSSDPDPEA